MTDSEIEFFLKLKYGNMFDAVNAFKTAYNLHDWPVMCSDLAADEALKEWAFQGFPEKIEVRKEMASLHIALRFGDMQTAYQWWCSVPPNIDLIEEKVLSQHEIDFILDYVPNPPRS